MLITQVRTCAFSPGGSQLATGSFDGSIRLWDPKSGKVLSVLPGHEVSSVLGSIQHELESVHANGSVKI